MGSQKSFKAKEVPMKINHFICPNCGHDFYSEAACVSCDACQCCFYASQSKTVLKNNYVFYGYPFITDGEGENRCMKKL